MTTLTRTSLRHLGERVAAAGVDVDVAAVTELAAVADAAGVSRVLTGILVDPTEPSVARLRAFQRVSCAVGRLVALPTRTSVTIAA